MPHILIADDDADIRMLVELQVEMLGFTFVSVGDGGAALDALVQTSFDLAVLDVSMPRATGLEVTQQVRAVDPGHELPIILMSAFSTDEDVRRGLDAGADRYLTKPLSLRNLRGIMVDLLGADTQS